MKPSIFSKDYHKYVRRKKRIKTFIIILVIIIVAVILIFQFGIKGYFDRVLNTPVNPNTEINNNTGSKTGNEVKKETLPEDPKTQYKEVKLNDSLIVKFITNKDSAYESVQDEGKNISYDISPSGKSALVLDKDSQTLYLIKQDGTNVDITYKKYISSKKSVFEKDKVLSGNSKYMWVGSPKFLSEDKIIYISNVPWFGNNLRMYLWTYDINTKKYKYFRSIRGDSIILNGMKDALFEVSVDGNIYYVDKDGGIKKS